MYNERTTDLHAHTNFSDISLVHNLWYASKAPKIAVNCNQVSQHPWNFGPHWMTQRLYTVFHKIGTPLYIFNKILPCGPISITDIWECSQENSSGLYSNSRWFEEIDP